MTKPALPNRWATEQWWHRPMPNDQAHAKVLRQTLKALRLHPRYDLARMEHLAVWEANCRAALPEMIAALDRTDLVAITEIARLLAVVPRPAGLLRRRG